MHKKKGVLYLVANTLGNPDTGWTIPEHVARTTRNIGVLIVENTRNARRYLKMLDPGLEIGSLVFHELNKHTPPEDIPGFLLECLNGMDTAMISDAGVPGVADPGAAVVRCAHEKGIRVVPLTGPSSILLSLMASGLNGQSFRFHGYLPVNRGDRIRALRELEQVVKKSGETQIFIETPYRNNALLSDILGICSPGTMLCVAADITLDTEWIRTMSITEWNKQKPELHKKPAVFLIGL